MEYKDDNEKRMYQVKIFKNSLFQKLDSITCFQDLRELILSTYVDLNRAEHHLKIIQSIEEANININEKKDFIRDLKNEIMIQTMKKISQFDGLTQVAFSSMENIQQNRISLKFLSDELLIGKILESGNFGVVHGVPGSGKTNFTFLLSEKMISKGALIITNTPFSRLKETKEQIVYCETMKNLFQIISENMDRKKVFILDEAGISFKKKKSTTTKNTLIEDVCKVVRKLKTSIIIVTQDLLEVPTLFYGFSSIRYHKTGKTNTTIHYDNRTYNISDVPKSKICFHTNAISSFKIDETEFIKLEKMIDK